ncbi:Predicted L-lactate dehydrogenase, hypothetical protein subunit YkgG [Olavius algarvensis associated proteobacterium Delta 3]|nr:Predicted L-lactate dehydrogenase, hypothetical protein subunit YkgG [Olavius algarvensis associated proteobacterium Delta 3]CAB5132684.1 Predicted L-lactate dehydrogenase, hypothetical protein subunit YkgG [Olavius algarvensis associated proteobacterium Delta 3]
MTSPDRDRIMARLHTSGTEHTVVPEAAIPPDSAFDPQEKITQLATLMGAMKTEVHVVETAGWVDKLKELARERGWEQLLYGPASPIGSAIETAWESDTDGLPALVAYTEPVESFKDKLFQIDAGITSTQGGIADVGAIVLWPTEEEPRLLSLVPPVHVAVLHADTITSSLAEMISVQNWAGGMPTNALLISGPSKTADIEFTLVFGVHGPKELVVFILK